MNDCEVDLTKSSIIMKTLKFKIYSIKLRFRVSKDY